MSPKTKGPRIAPDIAISESGAEPAEAIRRGDLDLATTIIDARLARGVFEAASRPVLLKDRALHCRWFNEDVNADHLWRAIARQGWLPVTADMLVDHELSGGISTNPSGHVVRGQRDQEHLLYMTAENYRRVAAEKEAQNRKLLGSTSKTKDTIAARAAAELGDEAAEWVAGRVIGDIVDSTERVERVSEEES